VPNIAFIMSQKMGAILGQSIIVEPRPGAAGTIAASLVARAPKDGYTLLFGTSSMLGIAKYMYKDLPYDPINDFAPVVYLGNVTVGVFTSKKSGLDTLQGLIAAARANPGKLNFSSPGIGSVSHLAGELFKSRAKLDIVHIPYQGLVAQMTDLIGGNNTEIALGGMVSGLPYAKDGRVNLVAVASKTRSKIVPDVPALGEILPGYDAPAWLGIVAPSGTPKDVLDRLEAAAQEALKDPETRKKLDAQGVDLEVIDARAFGEKMRRDLPLWEEAVKASGVEPSSAR
jgi:tripartite-type tricarboxylate transporter receptor subunit TctC